MIEFKGKLSPATKEYLINDSRRITFLAILIASIPFIVFIIILTLKEDKIHCLWFIPIALFMFFGSLKPSTKLYNMLLDKTYEGDLQWNIVVEGNVISAEGIQRYEIKNLEDVKKVVDMGDFYKIYFYFPHKSNLFICQKDLLVKGTIEEFEKLFSSVMVRKNNKI